MTSSPDASESTSPDDAAEASLPLESAEFQPLRIYPALILLLAMLVAKLLPVMVEDGPMGFWIAAALGPPISGGCLLVWWVLISRATAAERIIGFVGVLSALGITFLAIHPSMVPPGFVMLTIPVGMAVFGLTSVLLSRVRSMRRTWITVLLTAAAFGSCTLIRSEGMWGNFGLTLKWRWDVSAEDRLLSDVDRQPQQDQTSLDDTEITAWLADPEWPSFRGADSSGRQHGRLISDDWDAHPPQQMWKIAVGPGWSSFAVAGKLLLTQEQYGPQETTVCYHADTGQEIWRQEIDSRFSDPLGGPGPRATPAVSSQGAFVQGANGQVLRLNARTGDILWQKDLRELADRDPPEWGFSSSPLIVGSVVVVYAGGDSDRGVFGLDIETGETVWSVATGDHSYSSPQLCRLSGDDYVGMLTNSGICLLDPVSGAVRLNYDWPTQQYRALQPHVIDSQSLLLPTGLGAGVRRIDVTKTDSGLTAHEVWTSPRLKTDFNDFVVHDGHAWGFDGSIVCCLDLESGQRKWKKGRYGKGQILLLQDSDLLIVLGEYGDIVLLRADPERHQELAKIKALEGKTWNHPVVIGDRLYIRNSQEAACWQLPTADTDATATVQR